jgi:hypothetical protein
MKEDTTTEVAQEEATKRQSNVNIIMPEDPAMEGICIGCE